MDNDKPVDPKEVMNVFQASITDEVARLTEDERALARLLADLDASDWERMVGSLKAQEDILTLLRAHYSLVITYKLSRAKVTPIRFGAPLDE